jgi:lipoyl(octanoyl) transferase
MNFDPAHWRLILSSPAEGAWNMAVDEAILEAVGSRQQLPTLRLYAWNPPCLSLGYAQTAQDVDSKALASRGWQLVRRPTGGRAILHTDEITYSVIGPLDEPRLAGSVLESYSRLAQALLLALHYLSVPAEIMQSHTDSNRNAQPICFEKPSDYEITAGGKKIIGSAQARRKNGVLQHGSLPLFGDLARITQALIFPDETARQIAATFLLEKATTVEAILNQKLSWDQAASAYIAAFQTTLNLVFEPGNLSDSEARRATELIEEKYGNPTWNLRV